LGGQLNELRAILLGPSTECDPRSGSFCHQEATPQFVFARRFDEEVVGTGLEKKLHLRGLVAHDGDDHGVPTGCGGSKLLARFRYGLARHSADHHDGRTFAAEQAESFRCRPRRERCLGYDRHRPRHLRGQTAGKRAEQDLHA
jgi:hypothetical protein